MTHSLQSWEREVSTEPSAVQIVVALLLLVAWDFAPNALGGVGEIDITWPRWGIAVVSLYLTVRHDVHPVVLILAGAGVGVVLGMA